MDEDQFNRLIAAIRAVAHGTTDGPGGIEALTMAVASGDGSSLASAVESAGNSIADGLRMIAESLAELAPEK